MAPAAYLASAGRKYYQPKYDAKEQSLHKRWGLEWSFGGWVQFCL